MNKLIKTLLVAYLLVLTSCFGSKGSDNVMDYEGISFNYPSYWKSKSKDIEGNGHFIMCEEKFGGETIFIVSFFDEEIGPEYLLDNYIGNLKAEKPEVTTDSIESGKFGKYDSKIIKYKMSHLNNKFYGVAYGFSAEGKTVLTIKQSEKEYDLDHDKFKLIENSFAVKNGIADSTNVEE